LGYQSKSIVNKIIKLFYVFMLASIDYVVDRVWAWKKVF